MPDLVVRLKGGLGNQMFQYAAGRALALKNEMRLVLDTTSGFFRDKVYRRTFSMSRFPLRTDFANRFQQLPFWIEQGIRRFFPELSIPIKQRPWGLYLHETEMKFLKAAAGASLSQNTFMEGYWQSECYFAEQAGLLSKEFALPTPQNESFLSLAKTIKQGNSVSVGVRLFEEVPGVSKQGVGGVVPFSFYEEAAVRIAEKINDPTFFVFCTKEDGVRGKLALPGPVHYVTHDNGYEGELMRLWLITQCTHHILSNSSFYWWGAWLAERDSLDRIIIACDQFTNLDCVPARWITLPTKTSAPGIPQHESQADEGLSSKPLEWDGRIRI